jgi:copper(I)-binding protein
MFNTNPKSRIALALVAMLALSVVGGVALAADPTVDTSTTDATTTTSDVTANYQFALNDSVENQTLQYVADSNNSKVEITTVVDGTNETVYTNASPEQVAWDATNNDGNFNVSIPDEALLDTPGGINSNTTVYVTITNNTEVSEPNETVVEAYVTRGDNTSVVMVGDGTVDEGDDVSVLDEESWYGLQSTDATDFSFERDVTENTDTVAVVLSNASATEDFDDVYDGVDSATRPSAPWTGDGIVTKVDGQAVAPYLDELPDELDSDVQSVTYEQYGGQQALVYHLDSPEDDTLTVSADSGAGFLAVFNAYTLGLGSILSVSTLFVFGSVRRSRGA